MGGCPIAPAQPPPVGMGQFGVPGFSLRSEVLPSFSGVCPREGLERRRGGLTLLLVNSLLQIWISVFGPKHTLLRQVKKMAQAGIKPTTV